MEVFVFKTDIRTERNVRILQPVFANIPSVKRWTVDIQDADNVLRVVTNGGLQEMEIERIVFEKGFFCQALTD